MPFLPIIAQLVGAGGLPVITRAIGKILSGKDGALKTAGDLILSTSETEMDSRLSGGQSTKLALEQLKNDRAEIEGNSALFIEKEKTYREELASSSWLAVSWRPLFGLTVALVWFLQMVACGWAIIAHPELSAGIITAFSTLSGMWILAFSAIGVNIHSRSKDKREQAHRDAGTTAPPSLVESIITNFTGKK